MHPTYITWNHFLEKLPSRMNILACMHPSDPYKYFFLQICTVTYMVDACPFTYRLYANKVSKNIVFPQLCPSLDRNMIRIEIGRKSSKLKSNGPKTYLHAAARAPTCQTLHACVRPCLREEDVRSGAATWRARVSYWQVHGFKFGGARWETKFS